MQLSLDWGCTVELTNESDSSLLAYHCCNKVVVLVAAVAAVDVVVVGSKHLVRPCLCSVAASMNGGSAAECAPRVSSSGWCCEAAFGLDSCICSCWDSHQAFEGSGD